jgi:NhaP-type Na+/H+ or K+/H+ antiporter
MDIHIAVYVIAGLALLGMASLPTLIGRTPLSLPMLYIGLGAVAFLLPGGLPALHPITDNGLTVALEYATELVVILSLTGAGLRIDRRPGLKAWRSVWVLLGIAMPLSIAILAGLGGWWLGLPLASAVLLGAVLAPTDPVLAEDVQVGLPNEEAEDEVRFALTAEAGTNDGLAFPFTYLALAIAAAVTADKLDQPTWLLTWVGVDLIYKIAMGILVGWLLGRVLAYYVFHVSDEPEEARKGGETHEGLLILAATALAYGVAELFGGYGFLSVFVAAVTARGVAPREGYQKKSVQFGEQIEQALTGLMLVVIGGILVGEWSSLSWEAAGVALVFVLLVRPVAGYVALLGSSFPHRERLAVAFFGVRGVGSLYYLTFAQTRADFDALSDVWATVLLCIVFSVVLHGASATPAMTYLDLKRNSSRARAEAESSE